jgi:prevent-host-death family protein
MTNMTNIALAEAKAHFSELVERVVRGERFLVMRRGRPVAAMVHPDDVQDRRPAPVGLAAAAGALADWTELASVVDEIYAARLRATDRPAPDLD